MSTPRFRPVEYGVTQARTWRDAAGHVHVAPTIPLEAYPRRMTDRLLHWAQTRPDQTFIARRSAGPLNEARPWQHVSYAQALRSARAIAHSLLDMGLSAERPVLILSENSIEHALLSLGCLLAGVPFVPVSPAYSLVSKDFAKLRHVVNTCTPGLVFAQDERYVPAITAVVDDATPLVLAQAGPESSTRAIAWAQLLHTTATERVDEAFAATGPDTVVKLLFTSGSTKQPKAVINTHRMWCANQQQMAQSMPALQQEPLVLVDWLPWNHTFGGNHNFGMVLYHGGTLYIDDGKPTPDLMGETLRNLREISPTLYYNVPVGFEVIANAMRTDAVLRKSLLARVRMFFYAGASLAQPVWDSLYESAEQEVGERIAMGTGLGMTESSPFAMFVTSTDVQSGDLGLPTVGMELKLVECEGKLEVRYKGPNVTPGYWRAPQETAEAFDEDGFFKTGDAVKWIDEGNMHRGLRFDGRIAEDFKLATGTFVNVGPLRARAIAAGAPYIQDVVITGLDRKEVGALIVPTARVRELTSLSSQAPMAEVLSHEAVRSHFQAWISQMAIHSTGSANRIARACLLAEPPSLDKGEVTDKGSINQRAVLKHRDGLVQALYAGTCDGLLLPNKADA